MEAKDTVLKPQDRVRFANVGDGILTNDFRHDTPHWVINLLEQQAEVSFKAGIKEVVDWIKSTRLTPLPDKPSKGITFFSNSEFQSKLKEWGVD